MQGCQKIHFNKLATKKKERLKSYMVVYNVRDIKISPPPKKNHQKNNKIKKKKKLALPLPIIHFYFYLFIYFQIFSCWANP